MKKDKHLEFNKAKYERQSRAPKQIRSTCFSFARSLAKKITPPDSSLIECREREKIERRKGRPFSISNG